MKKIKTSANRDHIPAMLKPSVWMLLGRTTVDVYLVMWEMEKVIATVRTKVQFKESRIPLGLNWVEEDPPVITVLDHAVVEVFPTCRHSSSCLPLGHGAMSFLVAPLPFTLRVPCEGLPCVARWGLPKGVTDPLPASLKDADFYRLLSCSFWQIMAAENVWPGNLKNSSEVGVYWKSRFFTLWR